MTWADVAAALVPVLVLLRLELEARRRQRCDQTLRADIGATRRTARRNGRRSYDIPSTPREAP